MIDLNPQEFKKFFTTSGIIRCLHSGFLLGSSLKKSDLFLTYKNKIYDIFIKTSKEKICGEAGVNLYGNQKNYNQYIKEFREYVDYANKYIIHKYKKPLKTTTKEEFKKDMEFIGKFWPLYGFVEFPYMDLAYERSQNNKQMRKNLNEASKFKFKGREILNAFFFKNGVIENLLIYVSKNLLNSKDDADYLFPDEVLKVFDGWKPNKKVIDQRRESYSAAIIDDKIVNFSYKESLKLNQKFTSFKRNEIINGITANGGKAIGKAIIAPMLDNHKDINKINEKMKKGDVLITESTSPDTVLLCHKASAIVAEQSGMLSHAAVISRELRIPCIIQATNATRILKNGDLVEVDADKGVIRKL